MSQPHVFVTRRIPEPGLEILRGAGVRVTVFDDGDGGPGRAEVLAGTRGADVLLALLTERVDTMAATNALAHLRRERAPNPVNPEVYESAAYRRRITDR